MSDSVSRLSAAECFLDDGRMSDWERLGSYVLARRVKLGFKQRGDFASAVGVSARVISDIENGRRGNFDAVTIASAEEALGWETGSFASVAAGGEPSLRPEVVRAAPPGVHRGHQVSDEIEMIDASDVTQ